jgi:hypothetical protein
MKPDKTSIFDLFYNQRQFAVPLYQRPYVWTLEAQWQPLWQDIEDKARASLQRQTDVPHFLGAIVTGQRQVFGNQVPSWDIIDGQQRLTTLQIVLKSFSDLMQALGKQKYALDMERITKNDGLTETPDEQLKVWPTNSDRATFRDVMTAGGIDRVVESFPGLRGRKRRFVPKLVEAYVYFYRAMERFVSGSDEDEAVSGDARTDALFQTFRRHLQVVNIELETGDDPQVIFESLNGRGVALLPSDLVRNLVFMRIGSANNASADELYESYWKQFDEVRFGDSAEEGPWWKQDERQGRLKRPRLDLFLFHYVQYRLLHEVHIGHLFQEFRKWWERTGAANPAQALAQMQRHADAFRQWLEPEGFERTDDFARWLTALDTATVYPVLFLLLVENAASLPQSERDAMVSDLESYLVRRAVCGLTNKHYNRFFPALLKKLNGGIISRAALRAELASGKGDSTRWPGDEEFGRAFIHRPAYQVIRRPIVARLLDSLERALVNKFNNEVAIAGRLSIEHVMPQEWQSHWPLENETDDAIERRNHAVQTLGNLTLVTPEFNTKLSNREFKVKKKELKRTSLLRLNQWFSEDGLEWDESAIRERGKALFDLARHRWPHPESPPTLDALPLESPPDNAWRIPDDEDVIDEPAIDLNAAISLLDEFARAKRGTEATSSEVTSNER